MRIAIVFPLALLAFAGCSSEQMKRATYEALGQKECESRTGVPGCAEKKPSYDDYSRERDKTLSGADAPDKH